MNKKQYFMLLWGLCSVFIITLMIKRLINTYYIETQFPVFFDIVLYVSSICIYGFFLSLGMDFSQKIGMRFLLLDTTVRWNRDFFKPAMLVGVLYASAVLVVNALMPLGVFSHPQSRSFFGLFDKLFSVISYDAFMLLFLISGLALLLKKIGKNISLSVMVPVSIILISLMDSNKIDLWWRYGMATFMLKCSMTSLLGLLFWRKGFETALLCHIIVVIALYIFAPQLILGN